MPTKTQTKESVQISAPKIERVKFKIRGTSPYVQARFSAKAMQAMKDKMMGGTTSRGKKIREARDFHADFENAKHISEEGWIGIHAGSFRNALISACRLVGFKMTLAKMSIFVEADGYDKVDGVPLVKIKGTPEEMTMAVRNQTGVTDLRCRPMWRKWEAEVRITYDAAQFTATDIANLMMRVGLQVGVGEGRHDSRESAGMGWGCFEIVNS